MAAIYPNEGRKFLAYSLTQQASGIYVAWGNGSSGWDTTPVAPTLADTALVAEHGRRKAQNVAYAVVNAGGSIILDTGTYSISATPTNLLYVLGQFQLTDAVGQVIREVGVFGGTVLNGGVSDSSYVTPSQRAAGYLMAVNRFTAFTRTSTTRQNFEFVIEL